MVRRFRYLTKYPGTYDPKKWGADQSSMPSQHSPVPKAFDPSRNPDMQFQTPQGVPDQSIVRASFDSRPPYAYDFFFEEFWMLGVPLGGAGSSGYVVPLGFNLILREVVIAIYQGNTAAQASILSPFGDWAAIDGVIPPNLNILIDGVQTPSFTVGQVPLWDSFVSDVQVPCFIPIGGGSKLQVILPGYAMNSGVGSNFNTYVHYFGNTLVDSGRNLVNEVGNARPLPVVDVSKS